jgi:DNA-binding transcriptional regulator YiaG
MDKQEQDIKSRRRRSQAEIAELVAAYEPSGLSRIEFCRTHGLSVSTLNRYRSRRTQAEPAGVNLLAVELCARHPAGGEATHSGLAVTLAGCRRIEVARGFDGATLVQLLGVLERF